LGIEVTYLADYPGDAVPEVVEDGETFRENAAKKARAAAEALGLPALADDSGLCVDALDGRPGVYSARYAGEPASDEKNNAKLLAELKKRGAGAEGPDGVRGDQYVKIQVMLPDVIDDELRKAIEAWSRRHSYEVRDEVR